MSDSPTTTTPTPKPPRAKAGIIDQDLENAIDLAGNCAREAAKEEIAPLLAAREWLAADQTALTTSKARCDELVGQIIATRTGKRTRTKEEEAARRELLTALDPVLKGARRTYADGSAERKAYGIGADLPNQSAADLLTHAKYADSQLSPGDNGAAPKDKLKGVTAAEIAGLVQAYQNADWAQADAQKSAAQLLALLKKEITETLAPLTRDLQGAADQAYTHRDPANAAQRKAFGLQAEKPLND